MIGRSSYLLFAGAVLAVLCSTGCQVLLGVDGGPDSGPDAMLCSTADMPCPDGAPCTVDETCASLVCDQDTLFCVAARCGDSRVNGNEVCDTGGVSTAFCDADCTIPACNDGIFNPRAEACESNSVATTTCDPDCTIPECNDGIFNPFTEICDEGGDTPTCDADCSLPSCGDFHVNPQFNNEECDEGGLVSATCDSDCTLPRCGDGLLNPWPARSSTRR